MNDLIEAHLNWLRAGASTNTVQDRTWVLRMADRALPYGLEQATAEEIAAWLANPKWKPNTRWTYHRHLTSFYTWATDPRRDGLDYNPMQLLRKPRQTRGVPRPVSGEQLKILLTARRPWRTFVLLAALAGLRCIEMAGLLREDVTQQCLTIRHGKGDKIAILRTHPRLWEELEPYPPGPLAYKATGAPITPEWISANSGVYFRQKLGLPKGVTLHRVRHWYGTALLEDTGNLLLVQQGLRHSDVSSTQIYAEVSNVALAAAVTGIRLPA